MLFYTFNSQEERRNHNGSCFLEMQFCKMPQDTPIEMIVAIDSVEHWQNESLYIDDENLFYQEYSQIFTGGVYNNLQTGVVDIYGINYYNSTLTEKIIQQISEQKSIGYERLLVWLEKARNYNGFYLLGI